MNKGVVQLFEQALDPGKNWKKNDGKYSESTVIKRCQTVEIKFGFMLDQNPGLVPQGLPMREHLDRKQKFKEAYRDHGKEALKTGEVSLALLVRDLGLHGMKPTEVFGYEKTEPDEGGNRRPKLVVVLKFSKDPALPAIALDADISKLLEHAWGDCFIWDNTLVSTTEVEKPDRSVTVNCRRPLNRPATGDVVIVDETFGRAKRPKGN